MPEKYNRNQLKQIDKADLIDLIEALFARIETLQNQMQQQSTRTKHLENQLAKTSQNSSKPPSSDGNKKRRTRSLRTKTGRKPGGQKGHPGHTLFMSNQPDHTQSYCLQNCPMCFGDLSTVVPSSYKRRQVFYVPPVQLEITAHLVEMKQCPHCQQTVCAAFPPDVSQPVQYVPRFLAQASYLNTYHLIPMDRTAELLGDFYGQTPACALILGANEAVKVGSTPALETISQQMKTADIGHFDESGLKVNGKTQWVHVASTEKLTYFGLHQKRGQIGMREIGILPHFTGRAVHDHFSSYQTFDNCSHAYCNAHHLPELQFITDQYQQPWAEKMSQLLLAIKAEVAKTSQQSSALTPEQIAHFQHRYDVFIKEGYAPNLPPPASLSKRRGRRKQSPPKNLLDRLDKHKTEVLGFMCDFTVPFDNNQAERDIRMIKVKQKISGGFRTENGANTFCAIRSYISTVRKHGRNVVLAIENALRGQPFIPLTTEIQPE